MAFDALNWAFRVPGLNAAQKVTLVALANRANANEDYSCFISWERLQADASLGRSRLARALRELESRNLIKRKRRGFEYIDRFFVLVPADARSPKTNTSRPDRSPKTDTSGPVTSPKTSTSDNTSNSPEVLKTGPRSLNSETGNETSDSPHLLLNQRNQVTKGEREEGDDGIRRPAATASGLYARARAPDFLPVTPELIAWAKAEGILSDSEYLECETRLMLEADKRIGTMSADWEEERHKHLHIARGLGREKEFLRTKAKTEHGDDRRQERKRQRDSRPTSPSQQRRKRAHD